MNDDPTAQPLPAIVSDAIRRATTPEVVAAIVGAFLLAAEGGHGA